MAQGERLRIRENQLKPPAQVFYLALAFEEATDTSGWDLSCAFSPALDPGPAYVPLECLSCEPLGSPDTRSEYMTADIQGASLTKSVFVTPPFVLGRWFRMLPRPALPWKRFC